MFNFANTLAVSSFLVILVSLVHRHTLHCAVSGKAFHWAGHGVCGGKKFARIACVW